MSKKIFLSFLILIQGIAFSQINLGNSRAILDINKGKSNSIDLMNDSGQPLLAQVWVADQAGNKLTAPIAALPILQRLDPGEKKQLRLTLIGDASLLPSDRESLLSLHVLGIPPKYQGDGSVVNIALEMEVKLFYRPKGITQYSDMGWLEELKATKKSNLVTIENPTPYHVVVAGFESYGTKKAITHIVTLKPFSTENIKVAVSDRFFMHVINDYGTASSIDFQCQASQCNTSVVKGQ